MALTNLQRRGTPVFGHYVRVRKLNGQPAVARAHRLKPIDRGWLLESLEGLCPSAGAVKVLSVDDEEAARFIIREMLNDNHFEIIEAESGQEALRRLDESSGASRS